jgi:hypothetical protein
MSTLWKNVSFFHGEKLDFDLMQTVGENGIYRMERCVCPLAARNWTHGGHAHEQSVVRLCN